MNVVTDRMFDEAINVGNKAATMANRYMTVSRTLLEAVNDSLVQLESGLPGAARDVLLKTKIKLIDEVVRMEAPDLAERIVRTVAALRERNGAAPYDSWDAIHGGLADAMRKQSFEEARAILAALGLAREAKGD